MNISKSITTIISLLLVALCFYVYPNHSLFIISSYIIIYFIYIISDNIYYIGNEIINQLKIIKNRQDEISKDIRKKIGDIESRMPPYGYYPEKEDASWVEHFTDAIDKDELDENEDEDDEDADDDDIPKSFETTHAEN